MRFSMLWFFKNNIVKSNNFPIKTDRRDAKVVIFISTASCK